MNVRLLPHRRPESQRVFPAIPVPVLPRAVWIASGEVAHATNSIQTACDEMVVGGRFAALQSLAAVTGVRFCPACFPGERCTVCGLPSGGHDECATCLTDGINVDKGIERRVA